MLTDIEERLQDEVRTLRAALLRERRARRYRMQVHRLGAATSAAATRYEVADVIARGMSDILGTDWALVGYVEDEHNVRIVFGPGVSDEVRQRYSTTPIGARLPLTAVLRGEQDFFQLTDAAAFEQWPALSSRLEDSGMKSFATQAIRGSQGMPVAAISVGWPAPHEMDDVERQIVAEMAATAAQAFERAARAELDGDVAQTLQRWLLPEPNAPVDGLEVVTLYQPGRDELAVGGDWYDVVPLGDGRIALVVGDVVGHDVRAAAEMAQVRHVLASQLVTAPDPVTAFANTDRYLASRPTNTMATAIAIVVEAPGGDTAERRAIVVSAGHLPPILVAGDAPRTLSIPTGPPLGSGLGGFAEALLTLEHGALLVAFTDGLVERRGVEIDASIESLRSDLSSRRDLVSITDHLRLLAASPDRDDDVAALVARIA